MKKKSAATSREKLFATQSLRRKEIFFQPSSPVLMLVLVVLLAMSGQAQVATQQAAPAVVPHMIRFNGSIPVNGSIVPNSTVGITFALYKDPQGGAPLWQEIQNVVIDATGRYSVQLGSTQSEGIPSDLFTSGEARWLGIQVDGKAEQARVLLLSVPYALKAGDAETVGGYPPSAFVLATPAVSSNPIAPDSGSTLVSTSDSTPPPATNVTGTGTANFVPLWTSASNIGNSALFQSGSGTSAKVGINNSAPAANLDVKGTSNLAGLVTLPATGTATATGGKSSQAEDFVASSFNSSTAAAVNQTFQWKAEASGNNTTAPSGTLNLLFGSGTTAPTETGLRLSSKGLFTFATGQTFPGTGTITGVTTTSGTGLSGGGTTGTLALSLLKTCTNKQVLQWNGTAWACATIGGIGTITGVTAGTGLTGGGTTGTVTLNVDTTKIPQLGANNAFAGAQTINNNLVVSTANGIDAMDVLASGSNNGIAARTGSTSGYGVIGLSTATSGNGGGVYGQTSSPTGSAVLGASMDTSFLGSGIGVMGSSSSTFGYGVFGLGSTNALAGVHGQLGPAASQNGVLSAVWGDSSSYVGVSGTTDGPGPAIYALSGSGWGVYAIGNNQGGVYGTSGNQIGVFGESFGVAGSYNLLAPISNTGIGFGNAGAWGDSGKAGAFGVLGTVDDGNALFGKSNSLNHETLYAENDAQSSSTGTSFAARFAGPGASTYCEIYGNPNGTNTGELLCTGAKSAAVPVNGNRMVRLYAVEAADNWFEDAGAGQLANGRAMVQLDATFAQTINGELDYHVFVTAKGDCEGLYVAGQTAQGFEVHELRGGRSNVGFDYRIMARRRGFESVRMEDVTSHFVLMKKNAQELAARVETRRAVEKQLPDRKSVPLIRKARASQMPMHTPSLPPIATSITTKAK